MLRTVQLQCSHPTGTYKHRSEWFEHGSRKFAWSDDCMCLANAYPCTEIQGITSKKKPPLKRTCASRVDIRLVFFIHFVEESSVTPFTVWLIKRMTSLSDADEGFEIKNCIGWQKTIRRIKQYEFLRDARTDGGFPSSLLSTPMGRSPRSLQMR
jgi:hypothetical protein